MPAYPRRLLALLTTLLPAVASGELDNRLYHQVDSRVVCLHATFPDKSAMIGTGFFLDGQTLATVSHEVAGATRIEVYLGKEHKAPARILAQDSRQDLAVLQVPPTQIKGLPLATTPPALGDEVFTIGCPLGLDHSLSRGVVTHPLRELEGHTLIQTDIPVSDGNSGGPIFNARGEVIGQIMGIMKQGQGITFAVPTTKLEALLTKAGIPRAPVTDDDFQRGSALVAAGQLKEARTSLEAARARNPVDYATLTLLGTVLHKLGQYDQARETLIKAISIDASGAEAYLNLGLVYADGFGDNVSARQALGKYLELNPKGPEATAVANRLRALTP